MALSATMKQMLAIFLAMAIGLDLCTFLLTQRNRAKRVVLGKALYGSKHEGERRCIQLALVWIAAVVVVIATQAYEHWGKWGYLAFCTSCASLYVTLPYLFPGASDLKLKWSSRYITKANVWIAIFSFVGNYWYTHYFYRVLKAKYTFEAHQLNDVPICLYFMTHAYFMFYHAISNYIIRYIRDRYVANFWRACFEWAVIACFAYTTAFGEAITICAFPHYSFADKHQAYTLGSAFYAIYFVVSYPMFFMLDENAKNGRKNTHWSLFEVAGSALACSMIVLQLLDFVRLYLQVELFAPTLS